MTFNQIKITMNRYYFFDTLLILRNKYCQLHVKKYYFYKSYYLNLKYTYYDTFPSCVTQYFFLDYFNRIKREVVILSFL